MTVNGRSVLIVDDDEDIRELVKLLLEASGYQVSTAADGLDAFERLNGGERPGLILLDLMMPRMDGEEFLRRLRASPRHNIPVVVMSGHQGAADKAQELNADDCLVKPVHLERLLAMVRRYVHASLPS